MQVQRQALKARQNGFIDSASLIVGRGHRSILADSRNNDPISFALSALAVFWHPYLGLADSA